jgi:cysteinyl-tRNA synthetase
VSLHVFNTLGRRLEAFEPIEPGHVRMYACGITVYDLCHLGHARMMMAFDVVQRWLRASGWRVTYVRNITDVDDKIIKRALARGMPIRQLTDEMITAMHRDFAALGIEPPTQEPRATDYVPQMLKMIGGLQDKGLAYVSANGDVNFAVRQFDGYGKLSGKSLDELRAGERVAVLDGKQDPLDFVLWKAAKPEEPADAKWDGGRFAVGRPGWHIECSAMACALLGDSFDIHGGGQDLTFPHHENEIAQSEGANGVPFARFWLHNGFLNIDNVKMSKSLDNFFTIQDVLKSVDGESVRFFMLRTHYRSPFNFSDTVLGEARTALRRLYATLHAVPAQPGFVLDWTLPAARRFKLAMDDDFNTPGALAVLSELANQANREGSSLASAQLKALAGVLGLLQQEPSAVLQGDLPSTQSAGAALGREAIEALIAERAKAKAAREFARADAIRADLLAHGIELKDGPQGTSWTRR